MIRDCYMWRSAIKLAQDGYLEDVKALHVLIYVYGMDYIKKMDKKSLVEMVHQLELEAGHTSTYSTSEMIVEDWYKTV
ncbi:MAG: hypothetical protein PHO36_15615 [Parabacteroides sp.]|nr:hypothetical protein [Parabacteroides sp.]